MRLCPCGRVWIPVPADPKDEQRCPTCRYGLGLLSRLVGGKERKPEWKGSQ